MRAARYLAVLLLGTASLSALAGISLDLRPSFDSVLYTQWPLGDKPLDPPAVCSTWTCSELGTAEGEIGEIAADEIEFLVAGQDDLDNILLAHKTFASGDVQVIAQVPDQSLWIGYAENFTGFGVRCQEGTSAGAWFAHNWLPYVNDVPRFKTGVSGATSSSSGTSQSDSVWLGLVGLDLGATKEWTGWQSVDGSTWTQIGSNVTRTEASVNCGVFGTSQELGQFSSATLEDVTASSTITIFTAGSPPAFTDGPTAGTPTSSTIPVTFTADQTGSVLGVICADGQAAATATQITNGDCAGDVNAVAAFAQPVVEDVSDSDSFTGLSASTTYDGHLIVSSGNGNSTVSTLSNVTTDDDAAPGGTCTAALGSPTNAVINATGSDSYGLTANVGCRDGDDIVRGWDFSMPDETPIATRSGTFQGGNGDWPTYFKGKKLFACKIQWDEVETSDDVFDWDTPAGGHDGMDACQDAATSGNYDGVLVHVRGVVEEIRNCADTQDKHTSEWSAPAWLPNDFNVFSCNTGGDFQITGLDLTNGTIQDEYLEFIGEYISESTSRGFHTADNYWHVIHVQSSSRGEECCGTAPSAFMNELIDAWADGFGAHRYKLAWLKENPEAQAEYAVDTNSIGIRGGIGENWLRTQYTPGEENLTCQTLTTSSDGEGVGHMKANTTSCGPVASLRHFMDEIEFEPELWPAQQYIAEYLRMLQMRRNIMWIIEDSDLNPRLDDYAGTIMGKLPATDTDGWVWLMESRTQSGGIKAINNIERNIVQLESLGVTSSTNKRDHGDNVSGNNLLPSTDADCNFGGDTDCHSATWTRRESNASNILGFSINDTFWPISLTQDAVVKVTFIDSGSATVNVRDRNGSTLGSFTTGTSGEVRTATVFLTNFNAGGSGLAKDLELHTPSTAVDFMFLRVIKNGGTGGHATW